MLKTSENTILPCLSIQRLGERRRKTTVLFFIPREVRICFLWHLHDPGGLIHYVGALVVGSAATDFKGLLFGLELIAAAFIPGRILYNPLQR